MLYEYDTSYNMNIVKITFSSVLTTHRYYSSTTVPVSYTHLTLPTKA